MPRHAFDEHTSQFEFNVSSACRILHHVMMGKGVIAYGVTIFIHLLHQRQVLFHLETYHKERSRHVILLEGFEYTGSPAAVGTIIEGQHQLFISCMSEFVYLIV